MSARASLTEALRGVLPPTWAVYDRAAGQVISKLTVVPAVSRVAAGPAPGLRLHTVELVLLSPKQVNPYDELSDALDILLAAIDSLPDVTWTEAVFAATDDDAYVGWNVTTEYTTYITED